MKKLIVSAVLVLAAAMPVQANTTQAARLFAQYFCQLRSQGYTYRQAQEQAVFLVIAQYGINNVNPTRLGEAAAQQVLQRCPYAVINR